MAAAIEAGTAKQLKAKELTAARVLDKIRQGVDWDVRKLFTGDGQAIRIHDLDDDTAFLVQGVEYITGNVDKGDGKLDHVVKVKVEQRSRYVEMAAKYHGMLVDRVKLEDDKPLRAKVAKARERLAAARGKK